FFEIANARSEQHVGFSHTLIDGKILEDRHDPLAKIALEQVVEILRGAGADAIVSPLERPSRRGDVFPRMDETQEAVDAILGSIAFFPERPAEERIPGLLISPSEAVIEAQVIEVLRALFERESFQAGPVQRELGMGVRDCLDCRQGLVADETVRISEKLREQVDRFLRGYPG